MLSHIARHIRGNIVGYFALFAALGGTSYAAVTLAPGSVTTRALRNGAVTNAKLARSSVGSQNLRKHSLTAADFQAGALAHALNGAAGANGLNGANGGTGSVGPAGPAGPAGADGSASVAMTARESGSVTAPAGTSTNVPLTGASWTQAANDVNLIAGSMQVGVPASCTGSFTGSDLIVSVDGNPTTFGVAPTLPANGTVTVPFEVGELMEPGSDTSHKITASLANSCTKSSENYTISNVKIDVVNFH